jgi:hypothetical protein
MVTKEDIDKLVAALSEITKTLHHAAENISALTREIVAKAPAKKELPGTVKKPVKKPADAAAVVVDRFKAKTSINDTISQSEPTIAMRQPVHDIAKAIAINDRFLFIKELFEGNATLFSQTITRLNAMTSLDDAKNHLQTVLQHWDDTSESAQHFLSIVQRRYL